MAPSAQTLNHHLGPDGLLGEDVTCPICRRNLWGLSPLAACPQCGKSIQAAFYGELGSDSPEWIRTVTWGLGGVLVGGGFAGAIKAMLIEAYFSPQNASARPYPIQLLSLITVAAFWAFTKPGLASVEREPMGRTRRLVRLMATVAFLAGFAQFSKDLNAAILHYNVMAGGLVNILGVLIYGRHLAMRAACWGLARQMRWVTIAWSALVLVVPAWRCAYALTGGTIDTSGEWACICGAFALIAVLAVWSIGLSLSLWGELLHKQWPVAFP